MPDAAAIEAAKLDAAHRRVAALKDARGLARADFDGLLERRGPVGVTDAAADALAAAHGRVLGLDAALAALAGRFLSRWADGGPDAWRDASLAADRTLADGLAVARAAAARAACGMTTRTSFASPEATAARRADSAEFEAIATELLESEGLLPLAERVAAEVARRRAARSEPAAA